MYQLPSVGYGPKYDQTQTTTEDGHTRYLSAAEIAKLIRADIKAAVKAGTLPKAFYSVKSSNFAGGCSINVTAYDIPDMWVKVTEENFDAMVLEHGWDLRVGESIPTPENVRIAKVLEDIHWGYNHNGSDSMVDYYDVRYYGHAEVANPWSQAVRDEQKAQRAAKRAAKAA